MKYAKLIVLITYFSILLSTACKEGVKQIETNKEQPYIDLVNKYAESIDHTDTLNVMTFRDTSELSESVRHYFNQYSIYKMGETFVKLVVERKTNDPTCNLVHYVFYFKEMKIVKIAVNENCDKLVQNGFIVFREEKTVYVNSLNKTVRYLPLGNYYFQHVKTYYL